MTNELHDYQEPEDFDYGAWLLASFGDLIEATRPSLTEAQQLHAAVAYLQTGRCGAFKIERVNFNESGYATVTISSKKSSIILEGEWVREMFISFLQEKFDLPPVLHITPFDKVRVTRRTSRNSVPSARICSALSTSSAVYTAGSIRSRSCDSLMRTDASSSRPAKASSRKTA